MRAAQSIAAPAPPPAAGSACQVLRNTDSIRAPGNSPQISSAVKDRIGASQRTMASAMCHIAVCAERRGRPAAGVV